jgi:hypothetical protein
MKFREGTMTKEKSTIGTMNIQGPYGAKVEAIKVTSSCLHGETTWASAVMTQIYCQMAVSVWLGDYFCHSICLASPEPPTAHWLVETV